MFNPEKQLATQERQKTLKKTLEKIEKQTFDLISKLVPVNKDLRLDSKKYKEIYSQKEIEEDEEKVDKLKSKFNQNKEDEFTLGESLEIFKTYLFNKFKGNKFICVRTSEYDDYVNHVDNLIFDKNTGEAICAIDETIDINSSRFQKKKKYILNSNFEGGAKIKYFLKFEKNKGIVSRTEKVPIILIATPPAFLNKILHLIEKNNKKEFFKNVSIFFEGIKTITELYIIPDLEEEAKKLQKLLKETKYWSERKKIEEQIRNIYSIINKIFFFKNSLTKK